MAIHLLKSWFEEKNWKAFTFQERVWQAIQENKSGMLTAPTGSGKTYAVALGLLAKQLSENTKKKGVQLIWVTPIRALSLEIELSLKIATNELGINWRVERRTGDTSSTIKQRQRKNMPEILVTTPESLHVLLSGNGTSSLFNNLQLLVVDEWHDLLGTKRAVLVELFIAYLNHINPNFIIWGISATIGNMQEAADVLLHSSKNKLLIDSGLKKKIAIHSIIPREIETLPWSGYYGTKMVKEVIPVIQKSKTALIFTNTRAMAEVWYQSLLECEPSLAGQMAMHHGSISKELRNWVEEALHTEKLRVVVCTSSLDLGVDFRPVETVIQIGSPKGIARFLQRAGRSNHRPNETSHIYFVPTNALELVEAAALKEAANLELVENRMPYVRSFDVLMQFLCTLSVGDGLHPESAFKMIQNTFSFQSVELEEFNRILSYLINGGEVLNSYDDFKKLIKNSENLFVPASRKVSYRHRMSIGTIVSDLVFKVKYQSGGFIGTVEEWFITSLKIGDSFWFAGRNLELIQLKNLEAIVRNSKAKNGKVPSWMGGRMPLSSQLSGILRKKLNENGANGPEIQALNGLLETQKERSILPTEREFLIEKLTFKDGCSVFMYPFEGRFVHEGLAAIFAYRLSKLIPISFTLAYNDYGLELLSDQDIPIEKALRNDFFSTESLNEVIYASINSSEMAQLKFRDIAVISGMVFRGLPGKEVRERHLQASSSLIFRVLSEYDPKNLLVKQAYEEVMEFQLEENRMRQALKRIQNQDIMLTYPKKYTPLCFPILVDRLRQKLSSEKITDRIQKLQIEYG